MVLVAVEHDAGEVVRPSKITHDFVVSNTGKADLKLAVEPHRGCTVGSVDEVIAPGKSGKVSRRIARACGGDLACETGARWGARFVLTLSAAM